MKTKRLIMLLAATMLMTVCFAFGVGAKDRTVIETGNCGADGDNVTYVLYDDGELVISGESKMADGNSNELLKTLFYDYDSIIKVTIEDGVTNIGAFAFNNCSNLVYINLPSTITTIGEYAFVNCSKLANIVIPDSITIIEDGTFTNCSNLTSITLPKNLKRIKSDAFSGCVNLADIIIPDTVTHIDSNAFSNCVSLESIIIPNSVIFIGDWSFSNCSSLKTLKLGNKVKYIGTDAFDHTIENIYIDSLENWLSLESDLIRFDNLYVNKKPLSEITIPSTIKIIRSYAFFNSKNITSVIIPDTVTVIGSYAFDSCSKLKKVIVGNGVNEIGLRAFNNCTELESIKLGNSLSRIESRAFMNCTNLKDIYYNGTEKSWNKILIYDENDSLMNATIHCICEHDYPDEWSVLLPATCTERGLSVKICSQCLKVDSKVIPASHIDNNKDGICDECGFNDATKPEEPSKPDVPKEPSNEPSDEPETKPCNCDCHADGIKGFFFDLINFFEKLFGKNKICKCGINH